MKITHIDLFSGIGGAALAADRVWGKGNVQHLFCDNDTFCQKVLEQHWPGAPIFGDIRTLTADAARGRLEGEQVPVRPGRSHEAAADPLGSVDLLTGGFPCQPFSHAGRRKGTSDNRFLWPEMLRVIREFKPRWIVGENVAGLLSIEQGMVFKQIIADLEAEGYEIENFVIPAVAVNAPHRRDRVWIVAHSTSLGWNNGFDNREERYIQTDEGIASEDKSEWQGRERGTGKIGSDASNAGREYRQSGTSEGMERNTTQRGAATTQIERFERNDWSKNWLEVATWYGRMDDGVSQWLDRCYSGIISPEENA